MKIDIIPPSTTAAPAASTSSSAAPIVAASAPGAPAPAASTQPTPTMDDRSTAFRAVEGGPQMQSGEKLLVEAYAAIWLILFALILLSWRRQRRLDDRMAALEGAIDKARRDDAVTMGETPKPPPQARHEGGA